MAFSSSWNKKRKPRRGKAKKEDSFVQEKVSKEDQKEDKMRIAERTIQTSF
jgi:hypothetical protein